MKYILAAPFLLCALSILVMKLAEANLQIEEQRRFIDFQKAMNKQAEQ